MFKLLKSELIYSRLIIGLAMLLSSLFFVVIWLAVKERNIVPNQMLILLVMTFMAAYVGEGRRIEKKRMRFHLQLPLSLLEAGLFRIFYPLVLWLIILTVFFITSLGLIVVETIFYGSNGREIIYPQLNQFLILNGWIVIAIALYLVLVDARTSVNSKHNPVLFRIAEAILPFLAMAPFYLAMNFMGIFDETKMQQTILLITLDTQAMISFNVIALLLMVLNLLLFMKRSSYL